MSWATVNGTARVKSHWSIRSLSQSVTEWLEFFGIDFGIDLPPFRKVWTLKQRVQGSKKGAASPGKRLLL